MIRKRMSSIVGSALLRQWIVEPLKRESRRTISTDGDVIGIEVLHVRDRLGRDALTSVILEQLLLASKQEEEAYSAAESRGKPEKKANTHGQLPQDL